MNVDRDAKWLEALEFFKNDGALKMAGIRPRNSEAHWNFAGSRCPMRASNLHSICCMGTMLNLSKGIDSLSNFKRTTARFLERLRETGEPVILTINGKAELVVQDAKSYQRLLELAERIETVESIRQGMQKLDEGKGISRRVQSAHQTQAQHSALGWPPGDPRFRRGDRLAGGRGLARGRKAVGGRPRPEDRHARDTARPMPRGARERCVRGGGQAAPVRGGPMALPRALFHPRQ